MPFGFVDVEFLEWDGQPPDPPVSGQERARVVFDLTTRVWSVSFNGGLYEQLVSQLPISTPSSGVVAAPNSVVKFQTLANAAVLTMPSSPSAGQAVYVKAAPNSTEFPVTINGNGANIDGNATFVLDVDRQAVVLIYDGTEWGIW